MADERNGRGDDNGKLLYCSFLSSAIEIPLFFIGRHSYLYADQE